MVLSKEQILNLINKNPSLVEGYINLEEQAQPNGFDLTLREVCRLLTPGTIAASNNDRVLSELEPLAFGGDGYLELAPGPYIITYNEIASLPRDVMAPARPRSSLLRCGVTVGTAVWDAGYSGRSQSLVVVYNPQGFRVQKNARLTQLVFMRLSRRTEGYKGKYQGENI